MRSKITYILAIIVLSFSLVGCNSDINNGTVTQSEIFEGSAEGVKESPQNSNKKLIMPNSTSYYIGSKYTLESLTQYFTELGFTNIRSYPIKPDDDNYNANIFDMTIETGWLSDDPWEEGDEFDSDAEITIYYNESPMLTVDNCPDLITVLTSKDMDYMTFANKYDGQYIEFKAYVTTHSTYDGGTSHIINVTGGDYDGISKVGHYDDELYNGLVIRVGDRTFGNYINENVEPGENVTVSGRIDASWCEYYKQLYVECMRLSER